MHENISIILPTTNVMKGQLYWDPKLLQGFVFDGKIWVQLPDVGHSLSGGSFAGGTGNAASFKKDFEMFKAEWMEANPDGWWPEPYEEDQAWAELEASHELMRVWCEENTN